jgi:hypothetical protein
MKTLLIYLMAVWLCEISMRAQDASPSSAPSPDASEIPKNYEIGDEENRLISPDGKYAVIFPARNEASDEENGPPYPPNLLVRLKPYTVLAKVRKIGLPIGWRNELRAEWNGNTVVAIWEKAKWGIADLSVYEIENDKLKRVHPIFSEARKYFDRDFHKRFLKKYPKEYDHYTFVSDWKEATGEHNFEFKGRKVTVYLDAENKPNLAPGPVWSAELNGIWNLDTAKFEKVDFKPGPISIRKPED